jgi:ABC-2 type transport system permease protein
MNPVSSDPPRPNRSQPGPSSHPDPGLNDPLLDGPGAAGPAGKAASEDSRGLSTDSEWPVRLSRRVSVSALWALLSITAARQVRGRRLLILCVLFSLPILFAVLAHRFQDPYESEDVEAVLIFGLIPQALLPLAALLFSSGMVQDDVEEQTLTYLLIRPIPRWLIYLVKVAGTWLVTSLLTALFTAAALVAVYWGTGELAPDALFQRAGILAAILSLSLFAYTALFGGLSLLARRSLVLGVAYIIVFEGVVANIDFMIRHVTVMYYVRTLSVRWLGLPVGEWAIDPATAPSVTTCLLTLIGTGSVLALLGAWLFSVREFRVKTPEGR